MADRRASVVGTLLSAVALCGGIAYQWHRISPYWGVDFANFWMGSAMARVQGAALYNPEARTLADQSFNQAYAAQPSQKLYDVIRERQMLTAMPGGQWLVAFTASPLLYTTFGLMPRRYDDALLVYRIACTALTLGALLVLGRLAGISWMHGLWMSAAVFALFEPLASDQRVGNVNQLQLAMIAAALALIRSEHRSAFATGALLAAAVLFKPNVLAIALLHASTLLIRKEMKRLVMLVAGALAGAAISIAVSSLWFGDVSAWGAWLQVAGNLARSNLPQTSGNIAPFSQPVVAAILSIGAIGIAIWTSAPRVADANRNDRIHAAAGSVVYLLSASLVWLHYPVLALPLMILLFSPGEPVWARVGAAFSASLVAAIPWIWLVNALDIVVQTRMIALGLTLLLGLVVARAARSGRRTTAARTRRRDVAGQRA